MQPIRQRTCAFRWINVAWLCTQVAACGRGDVVLGEGGGPLAAMRGRRDAGEVTAQPTAADAGSGDDAPATHPAASQDASVDGPVAGSRQARASSGCGKLTPSAPTSGMRGSFLLDAPASYKNTKAHALVLTFRGMSATVEEFRAQLDLASVTADAAIVVHVNPLDDAEIWDFQRDIPWVDMLVAAVSADYCVDQDHIFAIGDGAGALFTNLLGCVRADKVRGIALLASAPPPPGPCGTRIAVWLLQQSDADPMLVSAGLGNRDFWATRNACDVTGLEPQSASACLVYANCSPEFPVHYCEHQGDALPDEAVHSLWDFS